MDIQNYRLLQLRIIISLIIAFLLLLGIFQRVAFAQEPAPFEISVTPIDDFAVSGQPMNLYGYRDKY